MFPLPNDRTFIPSIIDDIVNFKRVKIDFYFYLFKTRYASNRRKKARTTFDYFHVYFQLDARNIIKFMVLTASDQITKCNFNRRFERFCEITSSLFGSLWQNRHQLWKKNGSNVSALIQN